MKGLLLRSLTGELHKVDPAHNEKPVHAIQNVDEKLAGCAPLPRECFDSFLFSRDYYKLPLEMLGRFSFDELCKLRYSSSIMMDDTVEKVFERKPCHEIVRKIANSMWRCGFSQGTWNEIVDAYDGIRRFAFAGDSDFELRLDHTTWNNERGYSKYSRTYLDGVFAFLLYYRGQHVMTIGFSIMAGRRLLIQQVQSVQKKGNRYLYRLPRNRMEFVVGLFHANFPGYAVFLVDGDSLAEKIIAGYRHSLAQERATCDRYANYLSRPGGSRKLYEDCLRRSREDCALLQERVAHLEADRPRLAAAYDDAGRFTLGVPALKVNELLHREATLAGAPQAVTA